MKKILLSLTFFLLSFSEHSFAANSDDDTAPYFPKVWEEYEGPKVGVAILTFEDGLSQQPVANWINSDTGVQVYFGLGEGISNMFVSTLLKTQRFTIIDKKIARKVFDIYSDETANIIANSGTAEVKEIPNVRYFILGSLTDYSDGNGTDGGIGFGGIRLSAGKQIASLTMHMRIIDTSNGEVIYSNGINGSVEVKKGGIDLSGLGIDANLAAQISTPFGLAIQKVLDMAADELIEVVTSNY